MLQNKLEPEERSCVFFTRAEPVCYWLETICRSRCLTSRTGVADYAWVACAVKKGWRGEPGGAAKLASTAASRFRNAGPAAKRVVPSRTPGWIRLRGG